MNKTKALLEGEKLAYDLAKSIMADWSKSKVKGMAWSMHKIFRIMFSGIEIKMEQLSKLQNL